MYQKMYRGVDFIRPLLRQQLQRGSPAAEGCAEHRTSFDIMYGVPDDVRFGDYVETTLRVTAHEDGRAHTCDESSMLELDRIALWIARMCTFPDEGDDRAPPYLIARYRQSHRHVIAARASFSEAFYARNQISSTLRVK